MTKIKDIIRHLESVAPPGYQESYDNAGLLTGDANWEVTGVLACLDSTEAVIEEAVLKGCNLVVAHHPIIFKGLKRLTGRTYVERVIIAAIKNNVAVYAAHTNLDNVFRRGVNAEIAARIGLQNTRILAPKSVLYKASAAVAPNLSDTVRAALSDAGAAQIAFHPSSATAAFIFPQAARPAVEAALSAAGATLFGVHAVEDPDPLIGSGMIGDLPQPMNELDFLLQLKATMQAGVVRHTGLLERPVQRVAVCGGAGGFLLGAAIAQGADVFVTADYKYHEFFDADGQIVIADIGHFESEQFTIQLLHRIITEKFSTFAAYCTEVKTNPVHYL